ncbi:lasso peptide isopeptide bond-forming cyclase [Saccharopolyspora cebuensis]|uniref:asparagine synthase (glutamine-hydrolyzing) n=1 Tax=Saccharopolyspora cebuensis TaxID=418759 RepID=A0ABV4CLC8_9PSEU
MTSSAGFVVLPDSIGAGELRVAVPFESARVYTHASGRPWLVTRDDVVLATAGPVRLAVIGRSPVDADRLAELAARITDLSDVDKIVGAVLGSCHLVASVRGQVRIQGSLSGLRRVFRSRVHGVPVASDRADVLATMTGAGIDEEALAVRVACGVQLGPPAGDRSTWSGVVAVAPDHCVLWDRDEEREARWWHAPPAELSLEQGAAVVREALTEVVRGRAPEEGRLSSDLSGGMDSTTVCFLAARDAPDLFSFRWGEAEAGNDDALYAAQAARELPGVEHLVLPQSELPEIFADPDVPVTEEEPYVMSRTIARTRHNARWLAQRGSRRHLAGHGGDEVFCPLPGYLHRLIRRHPLTAWRHLRGSVALRRWPLWSTLGQILTPSTLDAWWRMQADRLTYPAPPLRRAVLAWGTGPLRASPWVTDGGVELAREALRRASEDAHPLAEDPGLHQLMLVVQANSARYRLLARLYEEADVELEMPYLDDRVIEAVMRVRPHEHGGPWRYKPLLSDAMRGLVPAEVLGRSTKGEFGEDVRVGLRSNLPVVLELFADSALASRGLIDPDDLRARLTAPQPDNTTVIALESLIGCETWLRTAAPTIPAPRQPGTRTGEPDLATG